MTSHDDHRSSRRRFFVAAGAAAAAPLAVMGAARARPVEPEPSLEARLAELEDLAAIRRLHHDDLRRFNEIAAAALPGVPTADIEPGVRRIVSDFFDDAAVLEISPDRTSATLRVPCTVDLATPIEAPGMSLVDMARLQGDGVLVKSRSRMLEQRWVRIDGAWQLERARLLRREDR